MVSLSLCMIVRDEARRLPEFLESVAGIWDQFVAVDTGSADATVRLLEGAGALVRRQKWADDFSRARNESLRHATGDWILVLDADEYPHPGFGAELRKAIANPALGAATVLIADTQKNGITREARLLRLFRNDPAIRFRNRIHEDATASVREMLDRTGRGIGAIETPIRHIGYAAAEMQSRGKLMRDSRLLKLAIKDDPRDLYNHYKLLEVYRFWGERAKMKPVAHACVRLLRDGEPIEPRHIAGDLVEMVRSAVFADAPDRGLGFLQEMSPLAAHSGHYHLALGGVFEALARLAEAGAAYRDVLARVQGDPARGLLETRALAALARLAIASGDMNGAKSHALAAARISPEDPEVRLALQFLGAAAI